jgi:nucleoside-diphosphate-sugar epimerase
VGRRPLPMSSTAAPESSARFTRSQNPLFAATNSKSEIAIVPYDEAYEVGFEDMVRRVPNISRIGELLGWRPKRSLDEILADVISSMREPVSAL